MCIKINNKNINLGSIPAVHDFTSQIRWTGNRGEGNIRYDGYDRRWQVCSPGKPIIECSNDPLLGGDPQLHNPEDLLINALSACHMLWFLHLSFNAGIVVMGYEDRPVGHGARPLGRVVFFGGNTEAADYIGTWNGCAGG